MGVLHAGILNALDNVQISAIAEKERIITNYIKKIMPHVKIYDDANKMCSQKEIDVVYITTPVYSHFQIAMSCIQNDMNFFMEKPLTTNLDDTKKLCSELTKHDLIHSVGYNRRFVDTFVKAKDLMDNKILGDIYKVKASIYLSSIFSKIPSWRTKKTESGGGVLVDLGSHVIDLLIWYFGRIEEVSGETKSVYSGEVEDFAHMNIEFRNKIKGEFDTSWSIKGYRLPEINVEVFGSNGKLRVTEDFIETDLKNPVPQLDNIQMKISKQSLNTGVPFDLGGPEYAKEDLYMVNCVRNKKQSFVNVFEASKTQSVIQAMYDCAGKGSRKVEYVDQN